MKLKKKNNYYIWRREFVSTQKMLSNSNVKIFISSMMMFCCYWCRCRLFGEKYILREKKKFNFHFRVNLKSIIELFGDFCFLSLSQSRRRCQNLPRWRVRETFHILVHISKILCHPLPVSICAPDFFLCVCLY